MIIKSPAKGKYIKIVTGHTARIDGHNSARRDQTQQ
jgi:hypothetical protein